MIHKQRSQNGNWNLVMDGKIVGSVEYYDKTQTQKVWVGSISLMQANGKMYEETFDCSKHDRGNSAKTVIDYFNEVIPTLNLRVDTTVKREYSWAITSSQVDELNVYGVARQFGFYVGELSTQEAVLFVQQQLKARSNRKGFSDLAGRLRQGELQVTNFSEHFCGE